METFVYLHLDREWIPAGRLRFDYRGRESRSVFAYGREYLSRYNALPIDPISLPLSEQEFVTERVFKSSAAFAMRS